MNNSGRTTSTRQALADAITVADQHNLARSSRPPGTTARTTNSSPTYPASYDIPNVVSVAATDNTDNRAYFSNIGRQSVDLGAPGVDIYSTWPERLPVI
jgi:subtilisin family serine protease